LLLPFIEYISETLPRYLETFDFSDD